MPFISVVIPCYNAGSYIERCLLALEQQSYRDFDVILVNDCSEDHTAEVIRSFQGTHPLNILYLENETNSGPGISRNNGIAASTAEYIAFCDSDDWYDPDYLKKMADAAIQNEADIVFCNSKKVLPGGQMAVIENFSAIPQRPTTKEILTFGIDSLCCLMVKRSIIRQIPQPNLRNGEDMAIIPLMIMNSHRFGFVLEPIYNYLCRPGSLSLNANQRVVRSLEISFDYITSHQSSGYEIEVEYIGIKNVVYGALLNHFKCSNDSASAKEVLLRFEDHYPHWSKNPYIKNLPLYKRVFVFFAKIRFFAGIKLLCYIHKRLTEKEH